MSDFARRFGGFAVSAKPGDDPDNPITRESGADFSSRFFAQTLGPNAESIAQYFRDSGKEATVNREGRVVIKGEDGRFRVLDEDQASLADLADIVDEAVKITGEIGAGVLGAGVNPAVGIAAGAGVGAALEGVRSGLAAAAGFEQTPGDVAKRVGLEALIGGTAEAGGLVLGGAGRLARSGIGRAVSKVGGSVSSAAGDSGVRSRLGEALRAPLAREQAETGLEKAALVEEQGRLALRKADASLRPLRSAVSDADAELKSATAKLSEARRAEARALQSRVRKSEANAEAALRAGVERAGTSPTAAVARRIPSSRALSSLSTQIVDPARGLTAAALERVPELGAILRKSFGDEVVPIFADGTKRGSFAMRSREEFFGRLQRESPESFALSLEEYARNISRFVIGDDRFATQLAEGEVEQLAKAIQGDVTEETVELVTKAIQRVVPAEEELAETAVVREARLARDAARAQKDEATAALAQSEEAKTLRGARETQKENLARTTEARLRVREAGGGGRGAYSGFTFRDLANRPAGPFGGAIGGGLLGGPYGAILGAFLTSQKGRQAGRRLADLAGRVIQGETKLGAALTGADTGVREAMTKAMAKFQTDGPAKGRAALQAALRQPAVREFFDQGGRAAADDQPEQSPTQRVMNDPAVLQAALEKGEPPEDVAEKIQNLLERVGQGDEKIYRMQIWSLLHVPSFRDWITNSA